MADNSTLGKVALLASLAAGAIAIYQFLKGSECSTPGSMFYGSSICGWLGMTPVVVAAPKTIPTTPPTSPGAPLSSPQAPSTPSGLPSASALQNWMVKAIGTQYANLSQWNYAVSAILYGTDPVTGNPNPGPFVGPGGLPGFTTNTSVATAAQYLAGMQSYLQAGGVVPGLSGTNWSGFGAYWVPGSAVHGGIYG